MDKLLQAIQNNDLESLNAALPGVENINQPLSDGRELIHIAAEVGDQDILKALIAAGANPTSRGYKNSALMPKQIAMIGGHHSAWDVLHKAELELGNLSTEAQLIMNEKPIKKMLGIKIMDCLNGNMTFIEYEKHVNEVFTDEEKKLIINLVTNQDLLKSYIDNFNTSEIYNLIPLAKAIKPDVNLYNFFSRPKESVHNLLAQSMLWILESRLNDKDLLKATENLIFVYSDLLDQQISSKYNLPMYSKAYQLVIENASNIHLERLTKDAFSKFQLKNEHLEWIINEAIKRDLNKHIELDYQEQANLLSKMLSNSALRENLKRFDFFHEVDWRAIAVKHNYQHEFKKMLDDPELIKDKNDFIDYYHGSVVMHNFKNERGTTEFMNALSSAPHNIKKMAFDYAIENGAIKNNRTIIPETAAILLKDIRGFLSHDSLKSRLSSLEIVTEYMYQHSEVLMPDRVLEGIISSLPSYEKSLYKNELSPHMAKILKNADALDIYSSHGMTMLMIAASRGSAPLINDLINYGADVNLRNENGNNAFAFLQRVQNKDAQEKCALLLVAASNKAEHNGAKLKM